MLVMCVVFFFFQAEDGIRDYKVTGVQTCALPISTISGRNGCGGGRLHRQTGGPGRVARPAQGGGAHPRPAQGDRAARGAAPHLLVLQTNSERQGRVGAAGAVHRAALQTAAQPRHLSRLLHQVRPAAARSGHVFVTDPVTQPPPARVSGGGWWATVREALRGSRHDYTSGPLGRAIVLLAIPMVAEMIMESLFAVWDVYWVGRVGPAAQATVGLTESLLTLIYTAAMGLSIGVTAMVARRIGEKNLEGAAEAAVQGIALGVIVAVVVGAIGATLAPRLLALMGASPEVLTIGSTYARIMLGGNVVILLLFLINAVFRGAGDAAIAMRVLWLANSINILLGPCLILGLGPFPRLGVTGAAIATTIGRGTGVLYQLYRLWRGDARVSIRRAQLTLQPAVMRTMLRLSGTGTFQVLIGTASWIFLVRIISSFGTDAIAGYQIAIRIIVFALLPSWGLANAAATLVGQNLGAGRPERGERAVWLRSEEHTSELQSPCNLVCRLLLEK